MRLEPANSRMQERQNTGESIINAGFILGFMKEIPLTHIRVTSTRGVQLTKNLLLLWFNHGRRVFKLGEEGRQVAYTPWRAGIIPVGTQSCLSLDLFCHVPQPWGLPQCLGKWPLPHLVCVVTAPHRISGHKHMSTCIKTGQEWR